MKIRFLKLQNWLVLSLLSLLGFSGCRSTKEIKIDEPSPEPEIRPRREIVVMYGVPTANFHVMGRVVDAQDRPVQGIQLLRLERGMHATPAGIEGDAEAIERFTREHAVTTAPDGTFTIRFSDVPSDTLRLLVRDVDGEANGSWDNQIYSITVDPSDYQGGEGWNAGKVGKNVTIRMEERK